MNEFAVEAAADDEGRLVFAVDLSDPMAGSVCEMMVMNKHTSHLSMMMWNRHCYE